MADGFELDAPGLVAVENHRQQLFGALGQAFGPAGLLDLEAVHVGGQFARALDFGQVDELPAFQLGAVGQVGVFGERVVLPAAGVFDHLFAEKAGRAVEVEEEAAAGAGNVFEHEVAVEQHGLHFGELVDGLVEIGPAGLDDADLGVGKVVNGAPQEVGGDDKVGVEDRDHDAGGRFEAFLQCAGLEAVAVGAVVVFDGVAEGAVFGDEAFGERVGFVSGVIEDLNLQLVLRVVDLDDGFNEAFDDEALIIERQLDSDGREFGEALGRGGGQVAAVFEVATDHFVAVHAIKAQDEQDGEIGDDEQVVEQGQGVDPGEGIVQHIALDLFESRLVVPLLLLLLSILYCGNRLIGMTVILLA